MAPIRVARNVVIHQSLTDRFSAAFAEQVERNGHYTLPEGSAVGGENETDYCALTSFCM